MMEKNMENSLRNKNIFCLCCIAFAVLICDEGVGAIKKKHLPGYDSNGVYNPSDSYNRKFARSSHTEVADRKNDNGAESLPLSKRLLKSNLLKELENETRRCQKNTDGKYVDNYATIYKNILLLLRRMLINGQEDPKKLSTNAVKAIATAVITYSSDDIFSEKSLKALGFYIQIGKNPADSQRVNIIEITHLIRESNLMEQEEIIKAIDNYGRFKERNIKLINELIVAQQKCKQSGKLKDNIVDF
jgi:hypothetical protein